MKPVKSLLVASMLLAGLGTHALADQVSATIAVSLWDNGDSAMDNVVDSPNLGMAMGGDMSLATMGIKVDMTTVKAGEIVFNVTNDSSSIIHEMIVAPVADVTVPLPYNADAMDVDEDAAGAIGEVPETDPGASGSVAFHLDPGTYILFCNVPGHYKMGMWTLITVTD